MAACVAQDSPIGVQIRTVRGHCQREVASDALPAPAMLHAASLWRIVSPLRLAGVPPRPGLLHVSDALRKQPGRRRESDQQG
jgi:hypothetical protein